jgi:hypothetical protein
VNHAFWGACHGGQRVTAEYLHAAERMSTASCPAVVLRVVLNQRDPKRLPRVRA